MQNDQVSGFIYADTFNRYRVDKDAKTPGNHTRALILIKHTGSYFEDDNVVACALLHKRKVSGKGVVKGT